jgi:hypothetical protein
MLRLFSMAAVSLAVLGLLYRVAYHFLPEGPFEMDPHGVPGAFEDHLKRYQQLAQLVATLSTASIAFLTHFLVSISDEKPRTIYSTRMESACPWAIPLLGFSVIFALAFILAENLAYEVYSHKAPGQNSPYTRKWYATNLSFGYSSVVLFVGGYSLLAVWLLRHA